MSRTPPIGERRRALALCMGLLSLGGCVDLRRATALGPGGVNVESPVAPQVLAASRARLTPPRFSEVPPAPIDVRPAPVFKAAVNGQVGERRRLLGWVAANPPLTSGTESFAERNRRVAATGGAPPPLDQSAATEAFAAKVREAAKPPPPPS